MDNAKYIDLFVEEAKEQIQALENSILALEKDGYSEEELKNAYRVMHTLKGNSNILNLTSIADTAHAMEDLFDVLRERKEAPDKGLMPLLFETVDRISMMIDELAISKTVKIGTKDIVGRLQESIKGLTSKSVGKKKAAEPERPAPTDDAKDKKARPVPEGSRVVSIDITFDERIPFKAGRLFQAVKKLSLTGKVITTMPDVKEMSDNRTNARILYASTEPEKEITESVLEVTGISNAHLEVMEDVQAAEQKEAGKGVEMGADAKQAGVDRFETIRIRSKHLDDLLDLTGELMISNIRVNKIADEQRQKGLVQVLKHNARLINELQDVVLRMRMVPVDNIFQRFPRMVRDIAKLQEKKVNLKIVGNDIEVDRSLLDVIGDSLIHALRNAVDHGIEKPSERTRAGKDPTGSITVTALREQNNVTITVEDDGAGFDSQKILKNAISKGIVAADAASNYDEDQIITLAFYSGVSTASKVTDISGRGVGLDVIKNKIESLGGNVRLDSRTGAGTKLTIKLPLMMSIIKAMFITVANDTYAIPLENVRETTRISMRDIHNFKEKSMFRLREEVMPMINLYELFSGQKERRDMVPVLIVEKEERRAALIVSGIIGQEEIVVKNLAKDLIRTDIFSGATILGDGRVALIIDVGAIT